jgi:hypothetical protein
LCPVPGIRRVSRTILRHELAGRASLQGDLATIAAGMPMPERGGEVAARASMPTDPPSAGGGDPAMTGGMGRRPSGPGGHMCVAPVDPGRGMAGPTEATLTSAPRPLRPALTSPRRLMCDLGIGPRRRAWFPARRSRRPPSTLCRPRSTRASFSDDDALRSWAGGRPAIRRDQLDVFDACSMGRLAVGLGQHPRSRDRDASPRFSRGLDVHPHADEAFWTTMVWHDHHIL